MTCAADAAMNNRAGNPGTAMAEIDLFDASSVIADFDAQFADFCASSARTRQTLRTARDIAYGPAPAQRLDLFFPPGDAAGRPIHMFIHGGYWRAQVKEDYAVLADGIAAAGAIAAIVEYTLMPGARMARLVHETRAALAWLAAHAAEFGGDAERLTASGHSAGGHLVTYLGARGPQETTFPEPLPQAVLALSGLYDLGPITKSYLQPQLHLTGDEVAQWSPLGATPAPGVHFGVVAGGEETAPFHAQAAAYAAHLAQSEAPFFRATPEGEDHMSLLRQMARPGSAVWELLAATIAG